MTVIDNFLRHYIAAALWSSHDESDEAGGEPMDQNYSAEDLAPVTLAAMAEDCRDFQRDQQALLALAYERPGYTEEQAAHDLWLTRCGHGAGFWDRGLGEVGDKLSEAARLLGNVDLYVGDDGRIYG